MELFMAPNVSNESLIAVCGTDAVKAPDHFSIQQYTRSCDETHEVHADYVM
jgi:hypothetical protein